MPEIIAAPLHRVSEILQIPYRDLKGWVDEGLIAPCRINSDGIPVFSVKSIQTNQADIESAYQRIRDSLDLGERKTQLAQEIAQMQERASRVPASADDIVRMRAKQRELMKLDAQLSQPKRRSADVVRLDLEQAIQQRDILEQRARKTVADYDITEYRKAAMRVERLQNEIASHAEPTKRDTTELQSQLQDAEKELSRLEMLAKAQPTNANMLRWGSARNKVNALRQQIAQ